MNVTLNRRTLLDALEIARRWVVPTKDTPPICSAVLLRTDGDLVRLHRSDLDCQAVVALDAAISRHGEAAVSAHALYRIAKTSRATTIELQIFAHALANATQILAVRAGAAAYDLVAFSRDTEFPEQARREVPNLTRKLQASALRWLFGATAYAAGVRDQSSTDCLELTFAAGNLRALATNGHRAALSDLVHADTVSHDGPVYLPADTAARLLALKDECMVGIAIDADKRLHFMLGRSAHLSCRTVDRAYPAVETVVRGLDVSDEVVAQREQILAALDRATAVLGQTTVRLTACDDQLTVSGESPEGCARVVERLPARASGQERGLAINADYLTDALRSLTSSEVSLRIGLKALTVRPVLQDEMTQRQLAVVMGVNVAEEATEQRPDAHTAPGEPTEPEKKNRRRSKATKA